MARYVKRYDTLAEYLNVAENTKHVWEGAGRCDDSWAGGPLPRALNLVRAGMPANSMEMRRTLELLDKIDASAHNRQRTQWEPDVSGAFPVVGEYLQGLPMHMRNRRKIESDQSPIRILFEPSVSAGVTHGSILQRGAAICALAQRISEERPTELYVIDSLDLDKEDYVSTMTRLDTCPINLAQCVAIFSTPSFCRCISFNHCSAVAGHKRSKSIGWGLGGQPSDMREQILRNLFELNPQDILLQGGYLTDDALMKRDPVAWVNKFLDKQRNIIEE